MRFIRIIVCLLCASTLFISCGDDENDYNLGGSKTTPQPSNTGGSSNSNNENSSADVATVIKRLEFPKTQSKNGSFVIVHNALLNVKTGERGVNYCVEWDPVIHAQRWCCYQMYGKMVNGVMQGTNGEYTTRYYADNDGSGSIYCQYPNDTCTQTKYFFTKDPFKGSGYDHGHICPSADRLGSAEANYQTFFLTNMMPQYNGFNAGVWASMEKKVRNWSSNFDTLYVCKGGSIDKSENIVKYLGSGDNKIPVPRYFFMALLGKNSNGYTAMAFWIDCNSTNENLNNYVINIDALEEKTDIDFFCNLPDEMETWVESLPIEAIKAKWVI